MYQVEGSSNQKLITPAARELHNNSELIFHPTPMWM